MPLSVSIAVITPMSPLNTLAVVVVAQLHHLVAAAKRALAARELGAPRRRIEPLLQRAVERRGAELAAMHRRQHLDVGDRIEAEPRRDALGDQLDDRRARRLGLLARDEVEVAVAAGAADSRSGSSP